LHSWFGWTRLVLFVRGHLLKPAESKNDAFEENCNDNVWLYQTFIWISSTEFDKINTKVLQIIFNILYELMSSRKNLCNSKYTTMQYFQVSITGKSHWRAVSVSTSTASSTNCRSASSHRSRSLWPSTLKTASRRFSASIEPTTKWKTAPLWAAGDIVENRPPLSRWHKDHGEAFAAFVKGGKG